ncbi:MAG: hypothetical protein PHO07_10510 [Pirellulales bacterium]|jgi:hypothetical protein|nr:hypothetical protein [Pirellulales bacterium]
MRYLYFIPLLLLLTILPGLTGCGEDPLTPAAGDANVMTDTGSDEVVRSKPAPQDPNDI